MIEIKVDNCRAEVHGSGSVSDIIPELMVGIKSVYDSLPKTAEVKYMFLTTLVFTLLSGSLFNEEPDPESFGSFLRVTGVEDPEKFMKEMKTEKQMDEDETLRRAFEKASAYGD